MKKIELSQIEGGLNLGRIFTGPKLIIIYLGLLLSSLILFVTVGVLITIGVGAMEYETLIVLSLILINIFAIIFIIFLVVFLISNKKNITIVAECLKDVCKVKATIRRIDVENINNAQYQIEVTFNLNEKTYHKTGKLGNPLYGYSKFFMKKYSGACEVLYSHKQNEILFLK